MTIALELREDVAVFRYPAGCDGIVDEFDDLLERRISCSLRWMLLMTPGIGGFNYAGTAA